MSSSGRFAFVVFFGLLATLGVFEGFLGQLDVLFRQRGGSRQSIDFQARAEIAFEIGDGLAGFDVPQFCGAIGSD